MRVRLVIGQYPQQYDGQYMPNVLSAWDEFQLEDNQDGYDAQLAEYRRWVETGELDAVREMDIIVPDEAVTGLFKIPELRLKPGQYTTAESER